MNKHIRFRMHDNKIKGKKQKQMNFEK